MVLQVHTPTDHAGQRSLRGFAVFHQHPPNGYRASSSHVSAIINFLIYFILIIILIRNFDFSLKFGLQTA